MWHWNTETSAGRGATAGMVGLDSRGFLPFCQSAVKFPSKSLNEELVRGNSSKHKQRPRASPNTHLSLRYDTDQALARDQGREQAISTSQLLKPLAFIMCSGCESGQPGKGSNKNLQILCFLSILWLRLIHLERDWQGQRKLSVNLGARKQTNEVWMKVTEVTVLGHKSSVLASQRFVCKLQQRCPLNPMVISLLQRCDRPCSSKETNWFKRRQCVEISILKRCAVLHRTSFHFFFP